MITKEIILKSEAGLYAKTATEFVRCAVEYRSNLTVECRGRKSSGKGLLGLLSLGASQGDVLVLTADGPDEAELIDALVAFNEECR